MVHFALRFACVTLVAAGLAGCFQPVHGTRLESGTTFQAALSEVSVAPVPGYLGYIFKSEMDYLLTGGVPAKNTRYILSMKISSASSSSIVDSASGRAQNVTLQVQALYELRDTKTGKIRTSGRTFASAPFDRSTQRFATLRAQRDADERVGKSLAQRMRLLLATALAKEPTPENTQELEQRYYPEGVVDEPRTAEPGDDS